MVNLSPWLQSDKERFAGRHVSGVLLVLDESFPRVCAQYSFGSARGGGIAVVRCFLDEYESEDEQCRGESSLDIEEQSP